MYKRMVGLYFRQVQCANLVEIQVFKPHVTTMVISWLTDKLI